jgi:hypothetical protein
MSTKLDFFHINSAFCIHFARAFDYNPQNSASSIKINGRASIKRLHFPQRRQILNKQARAWEICSTKATQMQLIREK